MNHLLRNFSFFEFSVKNDNNRYLIICQIWPLLKFWPFKLSPTQFMWLNQRQKFQIILIGLKNFEPERIFLTSNKLKDYTKKFLVRFLAPSKFLKNIYRNVPIFRNFIFETSHICGKAKESYLRKYILSFLMRKIVKFSYFPISSRMLV